MHTKRCLLLGNVLSTPARVCTCPCSQAKRRNIALASLSRASGPWILFFFTLFTHVHTSSHAQNKVYPFVADHVAEYMAQTLFNTSCFRLSTGEYR